MDPISLAIGAVGVGMQIFGGFGQAEKSQEASRVSQDIARQEQAINGAKLRQMELEGRRMNVENIRNGQRARAQATNAAVQQGAQFGTGLMGGIAQINDKTNWNILGVDQGLQTGREIGGYNDKISADKQQLAQIGADSSMYQGLTSLGGAVMKAGPIIGQISQGFGGGGTGVTGNNYGYTAQTYGNGYT